MAKGRRSFDKEFKEQAVKMVLDQGLPKAEVSRRLGINHNTVSNWVKAFQEDGLEAFPGHGKLRPQDVELRQLREEVKKLRMEREFLKKQQCTLPKISRKI